MGPPLSSLTFSLFFAYAYPPTPTVKLTLHILLSAPYPPISNVLYSHSLCLMPTLSYSFLPSQFSFLFLALHAPPLRAISTAVPVLIRTLSYMY